MMKSERIKYEYAVIFAVIFAMLAFVSVESTSAATIYVPDDYATIQEAVDAANAGDTIIVRDGTYRENIDVKKRLTLKSEKGSENCIVQAAGPDDHVFNVSADHVEISGFSVEGANDYKKAGIGLHAGYCNISNNTCSSNNWNGIYLQNSNDNCISNNTCVNSDFGIYIEDSNHNNISNNNCGSNNWEGIHLRNSSDNCISNNNCTNNDDEDISLYWFSNDNNISNNNCTGGIAIHDSKNNKFKNNVMFENGISILGHSLCDYMHEIDENNTVNGKAIYYRKNIEGGRIPDGAGQVILVNCINITVENQNLNYASVGIQIAFSSYSTIKNNTCSSNKWSGINILNSDDNSIACNTCSSNKWEGIYLGKSNNNNISNNTCSNNGRGFSTKYSNTTNGIEQYGPRRIPSGKGISIEYSYNNNISNNNCSNNDAGIYLWDSY
ncbi:MAG: right-handed parallel beta-helix repeat-containing protein, partial [Methanophagales archaeon]|nr:right-handed parallel beta-helix repeat-containing protein [Methanophagales archaeon]